MTLKSSNHIICLPPKFKVKCVQSAALQECVRPPALPVCTLVTLTHVATMATGVLCSYEWLIEKYERASKRRKSEVKEEPVDSEDVFIAYRSI